MSAVLRSLHKAGPAPRWRFLISPRWLGWHAFAVVAFWGMCWLGDWQLHRALAGNSLSWAYTFEWPIFAVMGVIFWAKTIRDEIRLLPVPEPVTELADRDQRDGQREQVAVSDPLNAGRGRAADRLLGTGPARGYPAGEVMMMTSLTDAGFVEMRLGKVVGFGPGFPSDNMSFCVVLEGASPDVHLPIEIGETEAVTLSAALTGIRFARPMGPQFTAGLLSALGGRIRQVRIDRLVEVRGGTAYGSTVEVEGPSGAELVDARPSDALNLAALLLAPIVVAPAVLADAQARLEGDSPEAIRLRCAVEAEQMALQPPPAG